MNAKESYIYRLLDGTDKKFIVPVYQRPYSWKRANCELLLSDLMTVYRQKHESHFFGSIVYVTSNIGGRNEYLIIDGQQRITTISLLLLAIRNYVVEKHLKIDINPEKITNAYLTDQYAQNDKKLKLKLVQGDDDAYDRLIENTDPVQHNAVTVNYNYFYEEIEKFSPEEIKGLYDAVMKLQIVNISLEPEHGDDPQLIFESLNSTGKDLEESDKIRNYVLMDMSAKNQEIFYRKYWERLEKEISREDIDTFIRYYLAVKNRELANKNRLYFAFKTFRKQMGGDIEDVLKDMLVYAGYFKSIRNAKDDDKDKCSLVLARLNKLDVNTAIPLLFDLFSARDNGFLDDEELLKAFEIIENYIIRREICNLQTNVYNKLFVSMGAEVSGYVEKSEVGYLEAFEYAILSKTGRSRFPNNHDLSDKFMGFELYNAKPAVKKYILERLENFSSKEKVAVEEQIDDGTLTIEHIMPRTLTKEWKDALGENWELIHTKYKDTIGNLTLTAYNSDYSNLPFLKKRDMDGKGFTYSKLSLNQYVKNQQKWGLEEIEKRAEILCGLAEKIWWMPETSFNPNEEDEWVAWDDDYDYTGKAIVKMRFMGDVIDTDSIADAYRKININLYTLDPAEYAQFDNCNHNSDKTKLRNPYELSPSMYIEMNLSSQSKMDVISALFTYYDFGSNDLQFLVKAKKEKVAFNIDDESTYSSVTAGQLAFYLISKLMENEKIEADELEKLKTKEYSRETFPKIVYPVLADSRDANRGKSSKLRYRKTPVNYKGKDIYISNEWFDFNREDLINWYKKHMGVR